MRAINVVGIVLIGTTLTLPAVAHHRRNHIFYIRGQDARTIASLRL